MQLRVLLLPFHRTDILVALNSSQAASGSHAANAVFAHRDAIVTVDAWFLIRVIIRVFMNNSKM